MTSINAKIHQLPDHEHTTHMHKKRRVSITESLKKDACERARRRWRLLQNHVRITSWLSKDLSRRQANRFANA